jgi:enoyl-CoA hydratase/carnithine racemase
VPDVLEVHDDDGVRVLRLRRPEARNALSAELVVALHEALLQADADPAVRVLVLTGVDPAFCSGIDLKEAARDGAAYFDTVVAHNCVAAVGELATPVIGAVNGPAFTGGLELALGCDVLLASDRALFADTHARAGVLPGGGLTARLPRAVGAQWARRMSFTGEVVDAATALRIGLVTEVVPHERLLGRALDLARLMTDVPAELLLPLKQMHLGSDGPALAHALAGEQRIAGEQVIDHAGTEQRRVALMSRTRAQMDGSAARDPAG